MLKIWRLNGILQSGIGWRSCRVNHSSPYIFPHRATFYILSKQQKLAMEDATAVIEAEDADVAVRVNALIKRASLFIQQCKNPEKGREKRVC